MDFKDLSPELQEKAKACKSEEELAELAESVGFKLADGQLESVAGGTCIQDCPWHGAQCRVDRQCLTKTNCPLKSSCSPIVCPEFTNCGSLSAPVPVPDPD